MDIKHLKELLFNPSQLFNSILAHTSSLWPDKLYLKLFYLSRFHRRLDLGDPKSFNEKLNWMKLYYHNPLCIKLADKYDVKAYVREQIGKEHVVECFGVWESFDDIDWEKLPDQFVLKCTHDSSGAIICKDKKTFDKESAKKRIEISMNRNWYSAGREWVYNNIKPRIIADKLLDDHSGKELRDYKFWCFNGKPVYMYFTNKGDYVIENFYDMEFNPVEINHGFDRVTPEFEKPEAFGEMKEYAERLSNGLPFVRVDFFYVDGVVYFGECTFYDWGGLRPFVSYEQDLQLGELINLPQKMK